MFHLTGLSFACYTGHAKNNHYTSLAMMNILYSIRSAQILSVLLLLVTYISAFCGKGGFLSHKRSAFLSESKRSIVAGDIEEGSSGISEGIIGVPTLNVLGGRLQACCFQPKTGFYRVIFSFPSKVDFLRSSTAQQSNSTLQFSNHLLSAGRILSNRT